ncbi:MAG: hypothetical protein JRF15_14920 [Deltaproteobacteria bacterium]|nr:hypothetical protein [Deltaproteobacteria bacterium]
MSHLQARLGHSQRRICRALGISRSAVRYEPQPRVDELALTGSIVGLADPQHQARMTRMWIESIQ